MTSQKPTVLLIPGAWHRATGYNILADHLHKAGFETARVQAKSLVESPDSPRVKSHHEDADQIRAKAQELISQGKDVIAFCHSYGGVPTTEGLAGLAKQAGGHGVVHLIYCTAFALTEDTALLHLGKVPELTSGLPTDWNEPGPIEGTRVIIPDKAVDALYADVDPQVAKNCIASDLTAQELVVFLTPVTKCAFRKIPTTYIVCEEDRAIYPNVQRWMAKQAGITDVVSFAGASHSPFLSRPGDCVNVIEKVVKNGKAS